MKLTAESRVLVQGIMEPPGTVYTPLMQAYGTQIVAGVTPGHGGTELNGVPVFDLVEQAVQSVGGIDITVLFSQPYEVLDAALEAIASHIRQLIIVTEGVPPLDMVRLMRAADATETLIVGPNSAGVIVPGQVLVGTHPVQVYQPGSIGVVSRSGSLTYEVALELSRAGLGQSIAVSIGGDRIIGSSFQQWLQILEEDDRTEAIVVVGEIGGDSEEAAAHYIAETLDKPVVAYIAGITAPRGQVMGHAGAIVAAQLANLGNEVGTAEGKIAAFQYAKIPVADRPSRIPELLKKM